MISERVLSLDVSTKTGWSLMISSADGFMLEDYGQISKITEPVGQYPNNYVDWAYICFGKIIELIDMYAPDVLVIEETSGGSKSALSQKILEFIHFLLAKTIRDSGIKSMYIMTESWRREIGCVMSKAEKDKNKAVRTFKKKNNNTKVAYDENGKRIGISGRKHVNVRRANEIFGDQLKTVLKKKDEDLADALGLAYAYHLRRLKYE